MPVRLGELLLKEKLITPEQLQEGLDRQRTSGGKLGRILVGLGFIKDWEVRSLLARQYGVGYLPHDPQERWQCFHCGRRVPSEDIVDYSAVGQGVCYDCDPGRSAHGECRVCKRLMREHRMTDVTIVDTQAVGVCFECARGGEC